MIRAKAETEMQAAKTVRENAIARKLEQIRESGHGQDFGREKEGERNQQTNKAANKLCLLFPMPMPAVINDL